jgi:hypothetical protein
VSGQNTPRGYSAQRGGLPRTAFRKASWATAWRPGPAVEAARALRALRMVTVHSSCARRRGDALDGGAVGACRRQGAASEHRWGPGVAPGKKSGGGAHQGGRATVERREVAGAAVFRWEVSSDGVAASSGRSYGQRRRRGMWLRARRRSGTKSTARGKKIRPTAGGSALLKGAGGTRAEGGGSGASGDAWGGAGARERGPRHGGDSAAARRQATVARPRLARGASSPRYSGRRGADARD